ncbi:hypothetical protein [uncultured Roseovarius sp.]|uniref:hypothetical protein n=1 Tax=uncultured Roseovarius sp. TaxID=293344 RepID=UPI0025930792|nr:hypothetical protein [uncultured Roseovarius sp.]
MNELLLKPEMVSEIVRTFGNLCSGMEFNCDQVPLGVVHIECVTEARGGTLVTWY